MSSRAKLEAERQRIDAQIARLDAERDAAPELAIRIDECRTILELLSNGWLATREDAARAITERMREQERQLT